LIRGQRRLGINTTQMNIILQLLEYWVDPARKPFPTKKDIANRIGVTDKTVQTNIRELEKAGLVRRETRRTAAGDYNSNIYHLDGLIERVKKLEPEFAAEKEKKARAKRDVETPNGLRSRSP
jgi:predicted transcriptional regulator